MYNLTVETETELTPEELSERLRAALRTGGVVNSEEDIAKRLDGEMEGKSDVIPVELKKDGSLSSRSSVLNSGELQDISTYVNKKVWQIGREILDGRIEISPYEKGTESACTYCSFKGICGFDEDIPGYDHRRLKELDKEEALKCMRNELR